MASASLGWCATRSATSFPTNRREAQDAFERALGADRHSVEAKIGLATILVSNITDGWSSDAQRELVWAEDLLLQALEPDPNRSMAHHAMAMVRRSQGRLAESKMAENFNGR